MELSRSKQFQAATYDLADRPLNDLSLIKVSEGSERLNFRLPSGRETTFEA